MPLSAHNHKKLAEISDTLINNLLLEPLENFYGHISVTLYIEAGSIQRAKIKRTAITKPHQRKRPS